jgi:endonuclease IV
MDDRELIHKLEALKNSRSKFENISKMLNAKKNSGTKVSNTPSSN